MTQIDSALGANPTQPTTPTPTTPAPTGPAPVHDPIPAPVHDPAVPIITDPVVPDIGDPSPAPTPPQPNINPAR